MPAFEHAGSVSTGTLRIEDLVPKYAALLAEMAPEKAVELRANYELALAVESGMAADERAEYARIYLDDLTDALSNLAPEGWYFGSLEGDGADFGFWPIEPESPDATNVLPDRAPDQIISLPAGAVLGIWRNDA